MSRYSSTLFLLLLVTVLIERGKAGGGRPSRDRCIAGESIRCYECRSDELPDCGDPFLSRGNIPSTECDNFYTQSTFSCVKTSVNGKI